MFCAKLLNSKIFRVAVILAAAVLGFADASGNPDTKGAAKSPGKPCGDSKAPNVSPEDLAQLEEGLKNHDKKAEDKLQGLCKQGCQEACKLLAKYKKGGDSPDPQKSNCSCPECQKKGDNPSS